MLSTLFRWSIWGNKKYLIEPLSYSVGTFRRAFGDEARYVVCTDEPGEMKARLGEAIEIVSFGRFDVGPFNVDARTTWRKWCPTPRIDPSCTEFYVDSDVFLVGDPIELRRFSSEARVPSYLAFREVPGCPHKIGRFAPRVWQGIPPINAGLLGQRRGVDITKELLAELRWWSEQVPAIERESHDEQGAVVAVLSRYHLIGDLELLPQDRYRIVSPASNPDLRTLDGIVAVHATYPGHPAFHRFRTQIEAYMTSEPR